jgi:hypothetical protein
MVWLWDPVGRSGVCVVGSARGAAVGWRVLVVEIPAGCVIPVRGKNDLARSGRLAHTRVFY